MDKSQYTDMLKVAIDASLEAGQLSMKYFLEKDKDVKLKKDLSPVTEADKMVGALITERLFGTGLNLINEEGEIPEYEVRKNWGAFWVIDPIDGTKEFIRGHNDFTVNIALVAGRHVKLGVIYAPASGELYYGAAPLGAYKHTVKGHVIGNQDILNDRFRIFARKETDGITIVASRLHMDYKTMLFIRQIRKNNSKVEVLQRGSSLKFCLMAEGLASLYPRFSRIKEWDIAAGHAIAEAAGCYVSQIDGCSPILYNSKSLKTPLYIVANSEYTMKKWVVI